MVMDTVQKTALEVCRHFNIEGEPTEFSTFTDGHINSTYLMVFENAGNIEKYLVQIINTHVFKNPRELMENIVNVTAFLRESIAAGGGNPERETLTFLKAADGKYYHIQDGEAWRIYRFIDDSHTYNVIENPAVFESAGKSFGHFQKNLSGYPMDQLHETIKDFHNTPKRLEALREAVVNNAAGRADKVSSEIEFAVSRGEDTKKLLDLHEQGRIPLRVTHNDTKLNNILFDNESGEGICVIDLDTIMPGFSLYDFGDAIRFGANTAKEDETDLDKVTLSLELFEAYARGFLSACAADLTQDEVDNLAFSAKLMTYECGIRFLTDYLDGDVYFKTAYPQHNLDRARNQFKLVSDIESKLSQMNDIVAKLYEQYK